MMVCRDDVEQLTPLLEDEIQQFKYKVAKVCHRCRTYGFENDGSMEMFRRWIGANVEILSEHDISDQPSYSLASLAVAGYLHNLNVTGLKQDLVSVPAPTNWVLFPLRTALQWNSQDVTDAITAIAKRWRTTPQITSSHIDYIRYLEKIFVYTKGEPWSQNNLAYCLSVFARLWGAEYIYVRDLKCDIDHPIRGRGAGGHATGGHATGGHDMDVYRCDNEDVIWEWMAVNAVIQKTTGRGDAQTIDVFKRGEAEFGETETYARISAGISAKDITDVFAKTRTHVQATMLDEAIQDFSLSVGNGMGCIFLIHNHLKGTCNFEWMRYCVFLDIEHMADPARQNSRYRESPWLILFAGSWYVIYKQQPAIRCVSVVSAIALWFECQKKLTYNGKDVIYDEGVRKYKLTATYKDPQYPFAKWD